MSTNQAIEGNNPTGWQDLSIVCHHLIWFLRSFVPLAFTHLTTTVNHNECGITFSVEHVLDFKEAIWWGKIGKYREANQEAAIITVRWWGGCRAPDILPLLKAFNRCIQGVSVKWRSRIIAQYADNKISQMKMSCVHPVKFSLCNLIAL